MKKNNNKEKGLNEKISVAELRMYEGFYDGKDRCLPLTKMIVARDNDLCLDIKTGEKCDVYEMINNKLEPKTSYSDELQLGDLFIMIEKDLAYNTNIFDYMIESDDFYFDRLPYLQERFDLYSKSSTSYVLPELIRYKKKIAKDRDERRKMRSLLEERKILKNYNNKVKVIKINTKKKY